MDAVQKNFSDLLKTNYFWLVVVILCHFLFFLGLSLVILNPFPEDEKKPGLYIPAYLKQSEMQTASTNTPTPPTHSLPPKPKIAVAKTGIEKPVPTQAASKEEVRTFKQFKMMKISKQTEPVHLIGDKTVQQPLLVLLGKALTAHLTYPKIAVDFRLRGLVLIGFTLYPDGSLSNVQLVRSSQAGVLDEEALAAARAISPVKNVGEYLQHPKYLVMGILFG